MGEAEINDSLSGLDASNEYRIERDPDITNITPGAEIRYACSWIGRGDQPTAASEDRGGPRDGVHWYRYSARAPRHWWQSQLKSMDAGFVWKHRWEEEPGAYAIIAVIRSRTAPKTEPTRCSVTQFVGETGAILQDTFEALLKKGVVPTLPAVKAQTEKYVAVLQEIAKRFPVEDPARKHRHDQAVQGWQEYASSLAALLAKTEGKRRIVVRGLHIETATQIKRPLFLFLVDMGQVHRPAGKSAVTTLEHWVLVDWTNAENPRFRGEFEGEGFSAKEAIAGALFSWRLSNRYPAGHVIYDLPPEIQSLLGGPVRRRMDTSGTNVTEKFIEVLGWVAVGTMLLSGVCALFVAVPAASSSLLAASLVSSTAEAMLSIAERRREGIIDWRADVVDGLTVVGNLVGAGSWARGARVTMLDKLGKEADYIFIGTRVSADLVRGGLVAATHYEQLEALQKNPDMLPDERAKATLKVIAELTALGLMTAFSVQAASRETAHLEAKPQHLKANEPTSKATPIAPPATPEQLKSVKERMDALLRADGPPLRMVEPPVSEGHTTRGQAKADKPGRHLTTARTIDAAKAKIPPEETDFAIVHYPVDKDDWRERLFSQKRIVLVDRQGFRFDAKCEGGTLSITLYRRYDPREDIQLMAEFPGITEKIKSKVIFAEEIIDRMYQYFDDVGNPVERLEGVWAWGNYRTAKREYDIQIAKGLSEDAAAAIAVKHAITYPFHAKHYFTRVTKAQYHERLFKTRSGEVEDHGVFTFAFEREPAPKK